VYTPLPDWIQTVAIAFSIFLIAPSWASVINGYGTMNGRWEQMRSNYLVKFIVLGINVLRPSDRPGSEPGGPAFSSLIHYTDWGAGPCAHGHHGMGDHDHLGRFLLHAAPHLQHRDLQRETCEPAFLARSHRPAHLLRDHVDHGIRQGAMWQAMDSDGSLVYANFIETLTPNYPFWNMRTLGGVIFFAGFLVFVYNIAKTIQHAPAPQKA